MESNRDEAVRCVDIAVAALASGDRQRALRFIRIAKRLNPDVSVDGLLAACEKVGGSPDSSPPEGKWPAGQFQGEEPACSNSSEPCSGDRSYSEEHVELIREIKSRKDYYAVLGLEKKCSVEDIRRAYKKLSLKIHPDKNKAPGADEAFKIVSKAFKCLSVEGSRRQYDQVGLVEGFEFNHQNQVRRRRRRETRNHYFEDDFDPDEIFRSFFFSSQDNAYQVPRAYSPRSTFEQRENEPHGGGLNYIAILQFLLFLLLLIFLCYPLSEPHYSLQKTDTYQFPKVTENHGIEYFVKSSEFDIQFPGGSSALDQIEHHVVKDYKNILNRYCHTELQRRYWVRDYETPHCDKLRSLL
ncbi:Chaperone protein dnaJ 49 [Apostasia shenzhenica]|uniref:Chaperone protein dnaJ 49 n=1 Tax=Apostasia shenzhenica TaxID=1088818 RepID=A0A2I0A622_9ASPA|nr:Chaperone protein dnaJ 49 [Apostasia shenzhenica]